MSLAKLADPEVVKTLEKAPFASISTINADGSPQLTYIAFLWDGQALLTACHDYRVKYKNVLRDPRVALVIIDPSNPLRNVSINGIAETIAPPGGNEVLARVRAKLAGPQAGPAPANSPPPDPTLGALRIVPGKAFTYGF